MKERGISPDFSEHRALYKAAVKEAERIVKSPEEYRDFSVNLDSREAELLREGLVEIYDSILQPTEVDAKKIHPENGVGILNNKLESVELLDVNEKSTVEMNAREVDLLSDAMMQAQLWDMIDRRTFYPWDDYKYTMQSKAIISVIGQFEDLGGVLLNNQAKDYFNAQLDFDSEESAGE